MFPSDNGYFNLLHAAVRQGESEELRSATPREVEEAEELCRRIELAMAEDDDADPR